jgi:hypothetical protein
MAFVVCETAFETGVAPLADVPAATVADIDASFAPAAGWLCATRGTPTASTAKTHSFLTVSSSLRGGKDLLILNDGLISLRRKGREVLELW